MKRVVQFILDLFFICFLSFLFYTVTSSVVGGILIGACTWIIFRSVILYFYNRRIHYGELSPQELEEHFAWMGQNAQAEYFSVLFPKYDITVRENCLIARSEEGSFLLLCAFRFGDILPDDVAKGYRTAKENGLRTVYILGRTPTRKVLTLAKSTPLDYRFLSGKKIRKFLADKNALPIPFGGKEREKQDVKEILFSPKPTIRYFLLCLFFCGIGYYAPKMLIVAVLFFLCGAISSLRTRKK